MAVAVEEDVVGLNVAMHDAAGVDIDQGAGQFGHPEPNGVLGKGLARDVEAQIAAVHQVDHQVPARTVTSSLLWLFGETYRYSMSWKLYRRLQRKG